MSEIASARINTFGPSPKADSVPPSAITISVSQLQELIQGAVEQAIQPLQEEISQLREEIDSLRARTTSLESTLDQEISRVCVDIAYDRKRLAKLEHPSTKEPGKTDLSRAEKIERYLTSRPDHKATFETLRGHLGVDKYALNDAIKTLMKASPGRFGITRTPGDDKRKRTLTMLMR
jgi:FtsZ-binding cell division protein ZapB